VRLAPLLALAIALGGQAPAAAGGTPVRASGDDEGPGKGCVEAQEASVRAAGEGAPPKFSAAFYKLTFTLDVSLDGADGRDLPVSVETVCRIPRARAKEAVQLAGADGVAVVYSSTAVLQGRTRLRGAAAATAIDGADTATLTVRLAHPRSWRTDEDGGRVPTFKTSRISITD
jgi:hypothetical protein